jgi:predicted dinucleotide-binding enzyme
LIAADDDEAKQTVAHLAEQGGMRAIDAGPLRRARQLEQLGLLHISLQDHLGTAFASAVKFIS